MRGVSSKQSDFITTTVVVYTLYKHFAQTNGKQAYHRPRLFLQLLPSFTGASGVSNTSCDIPPSPLTFRHRTSVTPYTSPYGLARSCVFDKQSPGVLQLRPRLLGAGLIPKLRPLFCRVPQPIITRSPWCTYTCLPVSVCGTYAYTIILENFLGTLFGQIKPYGNFFRYLMCLAAGTGFSWFPSYEQRHKSNNVLDLMQFVIPSNI